MDVKLAFLLIAILVQADSHIEMYAVGFYQFTPLPKGVYDIRGFDWIKFKVKSPNGARVALQTYYDSMDVTYVVTMGGWSDTKSVIQRTAGGPYDASATHEGILSPNEFLPFWVSWGGEVIAMGRGVDVGSDQIISFTDPSPHIIHHLAVSTEQNPSQFTFETPTGKERLGFEMAVPRGLYQPDPRMLTHTETAFTRLACSDACFYLTWCRGFSYRLQECRLFDTAPAANKLSPVEGCETWSMRT